MSRQGKVSKIVKEGMQEYSQSDEEDELPQKDFTAEQWDMIDELMDMFQIQESEAVRAYQEGNYDFDKAVDYIQIGRERQKQKIEKQKEKDLKKIEKEKAIIHKKQEHLDLDLKKKKSEDTILRKSSTDEGFIPNARKSSYIVQQYSTDHYNQDYPSISNHGETAPSKTINIVVVGHVDAGKSTLVGVFLRQASYLDKKQAHKNQKQSRQMGMESFKHAWVTDSMEEERIRGVTIDVGVKKIQLGDRKIVFLDSPGHRDFIPNMITGAAQADYAILLIDVDNFESTFVGGGQTKEHAYIVKSLGVHKIIVAINKMDRINWNPERFLSIKNKLNFYLLKIGFAEQSIIYIPISAINAINITDKNIRKFEADKVIYDQSFFSIISSLQLPVRPIDKPFRMCISNFYDSPGGKLKGHCLSGKIEGGVVKRDDKLLILPQNTQCLVKDILVSNQKVKEAVVGDNVEIQIKLIDETYFETIKHGNVLSSLKYSIPVAQRLVVEALALELDMPILRGTEVIVYIGTNKTPARITKINFIYNPSNGTIIKKNPKSIKSNDCAEIQIETKEKVCAELFSNFKTFGRVIIRQKKSTLFVGTIKMIK